MKVLLVDDEPGFTEALSVLVRGEGHEVRSVDSAAAALHAVSADAPQLIILDEHLPDGLGSTLLPRLRRHAPQAGVVMLTGRGNIPNAVQAMRLGAEDYLSKPCGVEELRRVLKRRSDATRERLGDPWERFQREFLLLPDPGMQRVYQQVDQVADLDKVMVLVQGETGTGKEHVARLLHLRSKRPQGPFVEVHCGAVPETLLESELFGYEPGAFTGAQKAKPGLFETASGGTLFLDEIGEMPLSTQVKLLKVLEERRARRLGGTQSTQLDLRLVAATNRDLRAEVAAGRFRRDLYFRLTGFQIELPPLRQRPQDIPALAAHFMAAAWKDLGLEPKAPDAVLLARLAKHNWPGNVRELKNVVQRLVILHRDGQPGREAIEAFFERGEVPAGAPAGRSKTPQTLEDAEWLAIQEALALCQQNRSAAARRLGISRKTLFNRLRKKGVPGKGQDGAAV